MTTDTKRYVESIGRRKRAAARVRIKESSKQTITVNGRDYSVYFPTNELQVLAHSALKIEGAPKMSVEVRVRGGGVVAQAEATRHGIARALKKYDEELHSALKKEGYLRRDARMKERKKFGLHKARRAPQWSKR